MNAEPINGVLLIDKPAGVTSARAIAILKRKLNSIKKIGHAGTLDPDATGLLVCLVNSATRLASYAEKGTKIYTGTIRLGITTSTDDISGDVLSSSDDIPGFELVQQAINPFVGEISQRPPNVSAVKVDGKRAYKLAREGAEVNLKERVVTVDRFDVSSGTEHSVVNFEVQCSRGTYIRSLARDLGEQLGCGAALETLRRVSSAPFHVRDAVELDAATDADLIGWAHLFPQAKGVDLSGIEAQRLRNGDTRVLLEHMKSLEAEANGDNAEASKVICRERDTGRPCSLLIRDQGQWKIAANAL